MRNYPVLSFFTRTSSWLLLIFVLVSNEAVLSQRVVYAWWTINMDGQAVHETFTLFQLLGAVLYVPAVSSVVVFVALLFRHLYYRQTMDLDIHNGTYVADWRALTSYQRIYISNFVLIGFIIALCILCSSMAKGSEVAAADPSRHSVPDQKARWQAARLNPHFSIALDLEVARFQRLAPRYQRITIMRPNGVPAPIIYCLHQRESSGSFLCHPHEGSPLTQRTRYVPRGRLPNKPPPYTFDESAEDAYYECDHLDRVGWSDVHQALQGIESFNGLGYQKYHPDVPSPYLWAGTTLYNRGKYTGDGRFDRTAVDRQLGVMAILKRMQERGIPLPFKSLTTN